MKKLFVSAGLVAISAAALETAVADDVTSPKYWTASATLSGFYDDNYNISANHKGSFGLELMPTLGFHEPFQQTDLGLRYTYGLYYYQDRNDANVNPFDQTHELDVWLDHAFSERWHGNFDDTFASGQEPELLSPHPTTAQAAPYRVNGDNLSNHGNFVLKTDWTRLFGTSLSYNNGWYDYQNGGAKVVNNGGLLALSTPGGGLSNASLAGELDRVEENVGPSLDWHLWSDTTLSLGYQFSWVNYTANEPIAVATLSLLPLKQYVYHSADRDNWSQYGYLGITHEFTPDLSANVRVGASYTDTYADPLFPSTSWAPYADVSASYTYMPGSFVQLGFTHDISATDQVQPDSSGKITEYQESSVVYLNVSHKITSKLSAGAIGRVQYSTFNAGLAGNQDETDYGLSLSLNYQINQYFSVNAGYNYDDVQTGISGYGYSRNRVFFGVTASY